MKNTNLFTILTKAIVILLPFYVLLSLFFTNIAGIPKAGFFIKEFLIILIFLSLIYEFIKAKKLPKFEILDYLVFLFIAYGVGITLYNGLGIKSIIYGGRYDFMFLIVMLIYKHGLQFLKTSKNELLKLFLYSGALSLFIGIIIRFRLKEEYLIEFGYVNYISDWTFSGGVPIYHGLENSGIRRFQGILEGPNTMGYFLILFSGIFLKLQKKKTEFYVFAVGLFLFGLIILTYSRSALLSIFCSVGIIFLLNIKFIYKKYKKLLAIGIVISISIFSLFGFLFQDQLKNIILRTSSTTGHFDRMEIGIKRFLNKPEGSGLAESGPAYRNIYPEKQTKGAEAYYIPESWFIQVLTEGGIVFFSLFILILLIILKRLYKNSKVIFATLLAILVMNIFLHIFEATYLSVLTFIIVGLFVNKKEIKIELKK